MNPRLKSLAYRMLGSAADAEDIVQEAYLRLHQVASPPDNEEAFLYRVVSNLCVDKLRQEKVRRRDYAGPWLPEPLVEDDAQLTDIAQQLSIGFMLMLERLSPAERIVYVLREGFDFSFDEIGSLLDVTAANARQRAHRARKRMGSDQDDVIEVTPAATQLEQKTLLEAMMLRVAERDVDGFIALMSDDAVAYSDGGGVVSAAIIPVEGPERIAQVTMFLGQKSAADGELSYEMKQMNGGWGMVISQNEAVHSCFQIEVKDGLVRRIYVMRNPHKLALL